MPERIQLRRTKGWRKPAGAITVDRSTKWGNPFRLGGEDPCLVHFGPEHEERFGRAWDYEGRISGPGQRHDMWFSADDVVETHVRLATAAEVVQLYRLTLVYPTFAMRRAYPSGQGNLARVTVEEIREQLAGKDLACWCSLNQPCHADVLLELANA